MLTMAHYTYQDHVLQYNWENKQCGFRTGPTQTDL